MIEMKIGKLNELFSRSENANRDLFAEYRTNVLMYAGKHNQARSREFANRVRSTNYDEQTKVKLVKNHISRICQIWTNELISAAPSVRIIPHSESELQDVKSAELMQSVWDHARHAHKLDEKIRGIIETLVMLGEAHVKVFWDKSKGQVIGYEQEMSPEGYPLFMDPQGLTTIEPESLDPATGQMIPNQPKSSNKAVMSGDFVIESILPFNLLHDPAAEDLNTSRYIFTRKLLHMDEAKLLIGEDDEEKLGHLKSSSESTFKVFDAVKADYVDSKDQVLLKEVFVRPCATYPEGMYCAFTDSGVIIDPQPLPFGIFPILSVGMFKVPTTARSHSIIRNLRPLQSLINTLSSQAVQHALSIGDDKILVQGGSKIEKGGEMPGVRILKFSGGMAPQIMPGRTGEQFFAPISAAIQEMYEIANVAEIKDDSNAVQDMNVMIWRSAQHKKKFSIHAKTIESFLKDFCELYLKLSQHYLDDNALIKRIGKNEYVNIPEFKQIDGLQYSIKFEVADQDLENMFGKNLALQSVLQYAGKDLPPEAVGEIITAMPFLNQERTLKRLTQDARNADNDILAMDRGQYVPARKYENHKYIIGRLIERMKERSFELLPPEIQQAYEQKLQEHYDQDSAELAEIQAQNSQLIPTSGALVPVGLWVEMPNSEGGVKFQQWRAPYDAVKWLHERMEAQKMATLQYQDDPQSQQAQSARTFNQNMNQQQQPMAGEAQSGVSQPMPLNQQAPMP